MCLSKKNKTLNNNEIYPQYDGLSLVNIPHSILLHFGIKPFKATLPEKLLSNLKNTSNVILFLMDGFGMNLFKNVNKENNFFGKISEKRLVYPITSVFPPSTPPALTSINTGLTPKEHGIIEWYLYFKEFDSIIKTIPYEPVTANCDIKIVLPNNPKILFNGKTIYERLTENGINAYCFLPSIYKNSVYTKALTKGGKIIPYSDLPNLMKDLKKLIENINNSYIYIYIPNIDVISHIYGPHATKTKNEAKRLGSMLGDFFEKLDPSCAKKTGVILTSDHGQLPIDPSKTIYLNRYPEIVNNFKVTTSGIVITPTGNPRNVFLSLRKNKTEATAMLLKKLLKDKSEIIILEKNSVERLFGKELPHKDFYYRIGNILILPNDDNSVWYEYEKFSSLGHHGGINTDSMIIPFVASNAFDLKEFS